MSIQTVTDTFVNIQTAGDTYKGNSVNQTYSINPNFIKAGDTIIIIDQGGSNTIELVGGLVIFSSIVTANEMQLTLTDANGAVINIRGADTFSFIDGGNTAAAITGKSLSFTELVSTIGATIPSAGSAAVTTTAPVTIISGGGTSTVETTDTTSPIVTSNSFNYNENQTAGVTLATVVASDNTAVTGFAISSGNTEGFFSIDNSGNLSLSNTGAATGAATNDFEITSNNFTLGITASDAAGNTSTAVDINLTINDLSDTDTSPSIFSLFSINDSKATIVGSTELFETDLLI